MYDDGYSSADFAGRLVLFSATSGTDVKINTRGFGDLEFAVQGDTTEHIMTVAGDVGIGITNPSAKLHVVSPGSTLMTISGLVNDPYASTLRFVEDANPNEYLGGYIRYEGDTNTLILGVHNVNDALTGNDNDTLYMLRSNGYVGINAVTPAYQLDVNGTFRAIGTATFNTNVSMGGNLTVAGTVTAQEFHAEFVSSSIIYESGSTKFGDTLDDRHEFTGSVYTNGAN